MCLTSLALIFTITILAAIFTARANQSV
jgi:hypothetical protein